MRAFHYYRAQKSGCKTGKKGQNLQKKGQNLDTKGQKIIRHIYYITLFGKGEKRNTRINKRNNK